MSSLPTPEFLRASVPDDADRSYIVADLRSLAVPISSLLPDPRNARKHPEKNLDAVKASLRSFKQRKPVVVNSRTLIVEAGNGTLEAAKALGWQYVAAVFQDDDAVTATGYGLADNRSAELAEWDNDVLTDLIKDLKTDGVDVSDLGWSGDDLLALLPNDGDGEGGDGGDGDPAPIDKAAELQKVWQTARGQVWEIPSKSVPGRCHRVMCGDSTEDTDVAMACGGTKLSMVWTDPPYNVSYVNADGQAVDNDNLGDNFSGFLCDVFRNCDKFIENGAAIYISHSDRFAYDFHTAWRAVDWHLSCILVWLKDAFTLGRGDYHSRHEPILYGWKKGSAHHGVVDRTQDTVWEVPRPRDSDGHPTMKPVALVARAIANSSDPGDVIFDPFLGSGTTLIAAERECRIGYGMELSPKYMAVILERAKNAGLEPRLLE